MYYFIMFTGMVEILKHTEIEGDKFLINIKY